MSRKKIGYGIVSVIAVTFLLAGMQNCAQSESTSSTTAAIDCSYELVCGDPASNGNNICVSGRVVDSVDRTANLSAGTLSAIEIRLYDALAYASNPTGTAPIKTLTVAGGDIDSCGRYTTRLNVSSDTPAGFLGMVVSDLTGSGSDYIASEIVRNVGAYTNLLGIRNYLVSKVQDQAWSTAAGLSGTTFATSGTLAVRYYLYGNSAEPIPGLGAAGLVPTWNGSFNSAADYFFSDTGLKTMVTVAPSQSVTGANGVAFFIPPSSGPGTISTTGSCVTAAGASGTVITAGSALLIPTPGVITFRDINVNCN